jgi:hypothetical protein
LEDARSIADFIQTWLTDNKRWNSPKYLVGESYGTTRACLLAEVLSNRFIALNGIVLTAAVLDSFRILAAREDVGAIVQCLERASRLGRVSWLARLREEPMRRLAYREGVSVNAVEKALAVVDQQLAQSLCLSYGSRGRRLA